MHSPYNRRKIHTTASYGGLAFVLLWLFFIGLWVAINALLWPYSINSWLVYFGKFVEGHGPILWWHGALIGLIPFIRKMVVPVAIITFIFMHIAPGL